MSTNDPRRKILSRADAVAWRRAQRGSVVFTNGVFDLLHPGHVDVLLGARHEGDALVVGLNSDASVRGLGKGSERPLRSEADRAYVLAALEMIDVVVIFAESTPGALIAALEPDVLVKGGDYSTDTIVGARETVARGGRVVVIPLTPGHSTTSLVERLRATSDPD